MFKHLAFLCVVAVLAGCASAPKVTTPKVAADAKFLVKDFTFNLSQKRQVEGYPTQDELSQLAYEGIAETLENDGMMAAHEANAVPVSIVINYQRRFAGEDTPFPSKSVTNPIVSYSIAILEDDEEIGRITKSGLTTNKGFLSNLKTAATMGTGNDAQTEMADVHRLTDAIVAELKRLRE